MGSLGKTITLVLVLVFLASLVTFQPATVKAQTKTIIVPDDYPTITDAIGNATNGDTILVRSGTYDGPINSTLVINKSISIIGEKPQDTIINLYPAVSVTYILYQPEYSYTDAITITANSCSLQDLTLQIANGGYVTAEGNNILLADNKIMTGDTTGVNIQGSNCRVTDNVMDGSIMVTGNYNQIDDNSGCDDIGVGVVLSNRILGGSYNLITNNSCQGLSLTYSNNNVFIGNNLLGNSWEPSDIDITYSTSNFIYENQITGPNYGYGVRLWQSSNNTIEANDITDFFDAGLSFGASNNNLFALNNIYGTPRPYTPYVYDQSSDPNYASAGITLSTNIWSDGGLGNYWGDYQTKYPNATEVDNTWVGSIPYVINENNTDSYPLMSSYDILTASVQLPSWINLTVPNPLPAPSFPPQSFLASSTPTATPIDSYTSSPSSMPTVPEFPMLVISPFFVSMFLIAVILKHRKTTN